MDAEKGTPDDRKECVEKMLAEYERAQEIGLHTDNVLYEVAAIVWGANTLLLGFILEVPCDSGNQILVVIVSALGILMTNYVPNMNKLTKTGQEIAYKICRDIEDTLPLTNRLNNRIHDIYPKGKPGQKAITVLSRCFVIAWAFVLIHAVCCVLVQVGLICIPATPLRHGVL